MWENYVTDLVISGAEIDVNDLVQGVINEAYLQTNGDLQAYAMKVAYFDRIRKHIRDTINELQSIKENISSLTQCYEEKLESIGDDAQLANVDLQNILQKQQQTLQMISNISKMLHDTALEIIRKPGG